MDSRGRPITWPLTPYYRPGDPCIDVTTGLGYPKKANDARANPKVALLFSDPTGSGIDDPPQVLVQGTADVDARDLDANRERYTREALEKLPARRSCCRRSRPADVRLVLHAHLHPRPPGARLRLARRRRDARAAAVRRSHGGGALGPRRGARRAARAAAGGGRRSGTSGWTSWASCYPDGGALARGPGRLPVLRARADLGRPGGAPDPAGRRRGRGAGQPGLACVTAHDHAPDFSWQRNFQVRGDLVEEDGAWALVPQRMVGGFELPPASKLRALPAERPQDGALLAHGKKNETRT